MNELNQWFPGEISGVIRWWKGKDRKLYIAVRQSYVYLLIEITDILTFTDALKKKSLFGWTAHTK